jgi:hypothetical protein
MRNLLVTTIAAVAMVAVASFAAEAQTTRGAMSLKAAVQNSTVIENAACGGRWGARCPPGYTWNGRRCVPC